MMRYSIWMIGRRNYISGWIIIFMSLYIHSRYTFLFIFFKTRLCKYIHGILRGYLNVESRLVLNEYSLKRLMLELCARGEKQTCEKGGNPKQRCPSPTYKLNLRVLCPNHFTGKEKHLSGLESSAWVRIFCLFSQRATPPMLTLWDEHTSIAQCSTKCCVKRPPFPLGLKTSFFCFCFSGDATRSLFLCM